MATRSTITALLSDGRYGSIYCHFDGYPSHNGQLLVDHYRDQAKVDALIALGDLSVLGKSTDKPEGHSYDSPVEGFCVAYGRDRGEQNTEAGYAATPGGAITQGRYGPQEYNYLWDGTEWTVGGRAMLPAIARDSQ